MLGCYKRKSISIPKENTSPLFELLEVCTHGSIDSRRRTIRIYSTICMAKSLSIDRAVLGFRFSQSVIGNTLLTLALGLALTLLFRNHSTRPTAVWMGMTLNYFAIITGIFEIPDYRYRLVVEPIVGCTFGSALSVIFSKENLRFRSQTNDLVPLPVSEKRNSSGPTILSFPACND